MYSSRDTGEYGFTVHQGGLTEEEIRLILNEMSGWLLDIFIYLYKESYLDFLLLALIVGILIGKFLLAILTLWDKLSIAGISILIWVMIYPMMKMDFQSAK